MRVLLAVGSLARETGGPARTVPALSAALARTGGEISILSRVGMGTESAAEDLAVAGVAVARAPSGGSHAVSRTLELDYRRVVLRTIANGHFDIVHDNGIWRMCNHWVGEAATKQGLPLVISPRGMLEPWSLSHKALKKRVAWAAFQRRDLERAALVHATSEMEANHLRELGVSLPIAVIPNGVDVPDQRSEGKEERHPRVCLFLSRLHPKKGVVNLVDTWSTVRPPGWHLVVAGSGDPAYIRVVKDLIRDRGLKDCISLVGYADDGMKRVLFSQVDLFVLPSFSENFGVVVAEALAHAVPVVTTTGTPWSVLREAGCGWWVDPTVEGLSRALEEATALTPEERRRMGQIGRELVRKQFSWDHLAAAMRQAYDWVLRGGEAPACILERI